MEGKTNFSSAYRLWGTGIVECLEIIDVGCNLKEFNGLSRPSQPPPPPPGSTPLTRIFTTYLRHWCRLMLAPLRRLRRRRPWIRREPSDVWNVYRRLRSTATVRRSAKPPQPSQQQQQQRRRRRPPTSQSLVYSTGKFYWNNSVFGTVNKEISYNRFSLHYAQCIVIGPVCRFVTAGGRCPNLRPTTASARSVCVSLSVFFIFQVFIAKWIVRIKRGEWNFKAVSCNVPVCCNIFASSHSMLMYSKAN